MKTDVLFDFSDDFFECLFLPILLAFGLVADELLGVRDVFLDVLKVFNLEAIDFKKVFKHFDFAFLFKEISKNNVSIVGEMVAYVSENFEYVNFLFTILVAV